MKNNQRNHTGMFMFLTQVKAVLFAIISATSYYWFLGSTPFEIALGITELGGSTSCLAVREKLLCYMVLGMCRVYLGKEVKN